MAAEIPAMRGDGHGRGAVGKLGEQAVDKARAVDKKGGLIGAAHAPAVAAGEDDRAEH